MDAQEALIDVLRQAELPHFEENPDSILRVAHAVWSVIEQQTIGVRKGVNRIHTSLIAAVADDIKKYPLTLRMLSSSSEGNITLRATHLVRREAGRLLSRGEPSEKSERPSDQSFSDTHTRWTVVNGTRKRVAFPKRNEGFI